jgi:hypothetical protein
MEGKRITDTLGNAPIDSVPHNQPPTLVPNKTSLLIPVLLSILISAVVFGFGGYLLGKSSSDDSSSKSIQTLESNPTGSLIPTVNPLQATEGNIIGNSNIAYASNGNEIYLKHTTNLIDDKAEFPNIKERTITKVYSYDESYEPKELTNIDPTKYTWTSLIDEGINDSVGAKKILIWDRLFSFKKVPGSASFIFVMDWDRSIEQDKGSSSPYKVGREIFYFDKTSGAGKLNRIVKFTNDTTKMSYPKIDTFSQDNRYISLSLFGCWNCGGHQPETLLLDLKTLNMKNIGVVDQFAWKQNGAYQYKDYVLVDCEEPQPGVCTQDPNTLPLKTGQL